MRVDNVAPRGRGQFREKVLTGTFACLLVSLLGPQLVADEGAAEYREHAMEAVGGHMKSIGDIMRKKVPHTDHMALHANALAELASISDTLFPAGSEGGDALPVIWEKPDDFAGRIADFKEATANLASAIADSGKVGPAVQAVGQACKGCHDNFRAD